VNLFDQYKAFVVSGKKLNGINIDECLIEGLYNGLFEPARDVVDGGANRGIHTLRMSALFKSKNTSGLVFAYEPNPSVYSLLVSALSSNSASNVRHVNAALGAAQQTIDFSILPERDGLSGLRVKEDVVAENLVKTISVEMTTLDTLSLFSDPYFIKLDLEGGEFDAMRGGTRLMAKSQPVIAFEGVLGQTGDLYGYTKDDFFSFFDSQGYRVIDFCGQVVQEHHWTNGLLWQFIAVHREKEEAVRQIVIQKMLSLFRSFGEAV
jgi:FkbM family methyltransferase